MFEVTYLIEISKIKILLSYLKVKHLRPGPQLHTIVLKKIFCDKTKRTVCQYSLNKYKLT